MSWAFPSTPPFPWSQASPNVTHASSRDAQLHFNLLSQPTSSHPDTTFKVLQRTRLQSLLPHCRDSTTIRPPSSDTPRSVGIEIIMNRIRPAAIVHFLARMLLLSSISTAQKRFDFPVVVNLWLTSEQSCVTAPCALCSSLGKQDPSPPWGSFLQF